MLYFLFIIMPRAGADPGVCMGIMGQTIEKCQWYKSIVGEGAIAATGRSRWELSFNST